MYHWSKKWILVGKVFFIYIDILANDDFDSYNFVNVLMTWRVLIQGRERERYGEEQERRVLFVWVNCDMLWRYWNYFLKKCLCGPLVLWQKEIKNSFYHIEYTLTIHTCHVLHLSANWIAWLLKIIWSEPQEFIFSSMILIVVLILFFSKE